MIDRPRMQFLLTVSKLAMWTAIPVHAQAQALCSEGRMGNGQCVNAPLAAAARRSSILLSQSRISYTAYPVLPTGDRAYRYPNQLSGSPQTFTPLGPFVIGPGGKIILVR